MKVLYRISDNSYPKERPDYITNERCLSNFCRVFDGHAIHIIADNVKDDTYTMLQKYVSEDNIERTEYGHGALSFNHALSLALTLSDKELIYFVEDDYLHKDGAPVILEDGFNLGFDYVTLYDHPDKYLNPAEGGNPECSGRSEATRLYLGERSHFKLTGSSTMTFAAKVGTLKEDESILREWGTTRWPSHLPYDYYMFSELIKKKYRRLASPVPGWSTHGESRWLTPLTDWGTL